VPSHRPPVTFTPIKTVPEVGDKITALPKVSFCEIMKITIHPNINQLFGDYLLMGSCQYELWLSKEGEEAEFGKILAPSNHLSWLGDHWVLFQHPYKITIDEGVGQDWCVTNPNTQKTIRMVAKDAKDAIEAHKEYLEKIDESCPDDFYVGEAYMASIELDANKLLRQIAKDITKQKHPLSPLHGMDVNSSALLSLTSQLAFLDNSKIDKFVRIVENAFLDLTNGNGFQWYTEGQTTQYCSTCVNKILSCKCIE